MRDEIFKICMDAEIISKLIWFREMHGYGDDNADVALASDDENEKVHAHIYWTKGWCIPEETKVKIIERCYSCLFRWLVQNCLCQERCFA